MYDGALEFWVTVREHGAFEEAHEVEERRRSVRKAFLTTSKLISIISSNFNPKNVYFSPCFTALCRLMNRLIFQKEASTKSWQ